LATKACILIKEAQVARSNNIGVLYDKLLFSEEEWESAIGQFLREVKNPSLAVSNSLSGCVFLVENEPSEETSTIWNAEGYSTILRMSLFVTKFVDALQNTDESWHFSVELGNRILRWLLVVQELATDNLNIAGANDIWKGNSPELEAEIMEFSASVRRLVLSSMRLSSGQHSFASRVTLPLKERCGKASTEAFYSARALSGAYADLCEASVAYAQEYIGNVDKNDMWRNTGYCCPGFTNRNFADCSRYHAFCCVARRYGKRAAARKEGTCIHGCDWNSSRCLFGQCGDIR
jgi:hypothetical protein